MHWYGTEGPGSGPEAVNKLRRIAFALGEDNDPSGEEWGFRQAALDAFATRVSVIPVAVSVYQGKPAGGGSAPSPVGPLASGTSPEVGSGGGDCRGGQVDAEVQTRSLTSAAIALADAYAKAPMKAPPQTPPRSLHPAGA